MIITGRNNKLVVRATPADVPLLQMLPIRKFNPRTGEWTFPNATRIRKFFERMGEPLPPMPSIAPYTDLDASFRFKLPPRKYQEHAMGAGRDMAAFAYLMDPGTGKTPVLINEANAAILRRDVAPAVLLVCPNSIKSNWEDELAKHSSAPYVAHSYEASKKKHADQFRQLKTRDTKWFIIGVEQLSAPSGVEMAEAFLQAHPNATMSIDESSRIRVPETKRTKTIIRIGQQAMRRRIATGTVVTKAPHHFWPQFEFLDPDILDLDFTYFRGFFCQTHPEYATRVIGGMNEDILLDMVSPYSFIARKEDVLTELPPKVHQVRRVPPTQEQRNAYDALLADAEMEDSRYTTALVRNLRLHQITGGFIVKEHARQRLADLLASGLGEEFLEKAAEKVLYECEPIPGRNAKIDELLEIVQEIDGKFVIWARYIAEIKLIAEALRPFGKVVEFHGEVSQNERTDARRSFQEDPSVRFFVGNQATGGIGITLTAARAMVFFSNCWGAEDRIQAEDRIHRISQEHDSCLYIDLTLVGSLVDSRVYHSVMAGVDYHKEMMNELAIRQNA